MFELSKEFLEEQRDLGKTRTEIAKQLGIHHNNVCKAAKKYNIVFQPYKKSRCEYVRLSDRNNFLGKRIGRLTILKQVKKSDHTKNDGHAVWECLCDCGKIKQISGKSLRPRKFSTVSCGCYRMTRKTNSYEEICGKYWSCIITDARRRNIKVEITMPDIWDQYLKQDKKCNLSGQNISFASHHTQLKNQTCSVDRIDSNKNYTVDNIQIVHKDVNMMKWDIDCQEFIELCKNAYTFDKSKIEPIPDPMIDFSSKSFKGYKNINSTYWYSVIKNATKRNIEFSITMKDVWLLYLQQGGKCNITGVDIKFARTHKNYGYRNQTASVDRIDSKKPYTVDNIQIVHKHVNAMKRNFPNDYFISTLKLIGKYQTDKFTQQG